MGIMKSAAAFLLALLLATSAHAISPNGQKVVDSINQRLDQFPRQEGFLKGQFAGREDEARAHLAEAEKLLGAATTEVRMLISDSRAPEVSAVSKRIQEHEAYVAGLRSALQGAGKTSEQEAGRHQAFVQEYGSSFNQVQELLHLAKDPARGSVGEPERLRKALEVLARVHEGCTGKYAGVRNSAPFRDDLRRDAENWCAAAADREALAKRAVKNHARRTLDIVRDSLDRMRADLERSEGFLRSDETTVRQALWDRGALAKDLTTRDAKLFDVAGVTEPVDLAPLDQSIAALNAEIDRLAPQWKFPSGGAHDPSEGLARKAIGGDKGVKILRTVMTDGQWKIVKNGLGIPLHRYKDGAVLYRVAGEKWCRHQAFTYSEKFDGRGYQKTDGVTVNYLRYLACP